MGLRLYPAGLFLGSVTLAPGIYAPGMQQNFPLLIKVVVSLHESQLSAPFSQRHAQNSDSCTKKDEDFTVIDSSASFPL